jgi:hypothetical protein
MRHLMPVLVGVDNTNRAPAFENETKTAVQPRSDTDNKNAGH